MSDQPHNKHGHGDDTPMHRLWMAMTGASVGHHEEVPGINEQSIKVGHEPDQFDPRTIIYVPIVITVVLVIAYLIVQGAFAFVNGTASRQQDAVKFNERATRIGTTDAQPITAASPGDKPLPAVSQPRLERIQAVDMTRKDSQGNVVTDLPFLRSFKALPTGNSPEIYPENLRAEHFVDPTTNTKALVDPRWVQKDKVAVIPIDVAIHLMTTDDKFKLKVAEKPATPTLGSIGKSRQSTGGTASPMPASKKDDKKDDHKH
jgi:hypothetical protein